MVSAFRDPECVLGMRARLNESPQIREGQGQPAVRPGCEEWRPLAPALTRTLHGPRKEVKSLRKVADSEVGLAGAVLGLALELSIVTLGRDREGALSDLDGLTVLASDVPEPRADIGQDPPEASRIAEPGRQAFGFAHHRQNVLVSPE